MANPQSSPAPVTEKSDCFLQATYSDIYGKGYIPQDVQYRIDDVTNDVEILPWTSYTTQATADNPSDTIQIPASLNTLQSQNNSQELRQVIVKVTAPGGASRNDPIYYSIINRQGLT
jgi:hypothetical protein